ncbi:hypothetical protein [Youxingia wuxianensis]|uniref:DUF3221 domain-containing protein n=1 Tax=Youxingia wuxianensis TaxID=2763678 RepID=A0A926IH14_9FIRM|nr:hypothetical protein [Youxingia wuxianensis]MBC8585434.1 hypothetical protein [Youxingia wuxianensis]
MSLQRKMYALLLGAAIVLGMVGCAGQTAAPEEENSAAGSSQASSQEAPSSQEEEPLEEETAGSQERLYVADAGMYRGVVEDFAVDDQGRTVWILNQLEGVDFGAPRLQVALDSATQLGYDESEQIGNGTYLEVYYGGEIPQTSQDQIPLVTAAAVNKLPAPELVLFCGTITQATSDPQNASQGDLLVESILDGGGEYLFHYDQSTQFYLAPEDSTAAYVGKKVAVFHDPASTRSLPPQSTAWEVWPYEEGVSGLPAPVGTEN